VSICSTGNQKRQISLEVDELGLFNLKPRTHDIALINPRDKITPKFCEPTSVFKQVPI